jgi:hypothetical protein
MMNFTVWGEAGVTHKTIPLIEHSFNLEAYGVPYLRPLAPCHSKLYL